MENLWNRICWSEIRVHTVPDRRMSEGQQSNYKPCLMAKEVWEACVNIDKSLASPKI